jgi:hypothetical protein
MVDPGRVLAVIGTVAFAARPTISWAAKPPPTAVGNVAYAYVDGNGNLDRSRTLNVTAIGDAAGLYCFKLPFVPKSVVATTAYDPTQPTFYSFIQAALKPSPTFTRAAIDDPESVVMTYTSTSGQNAGGIAFYVRWNH